MLVVWTTDAGPAGNWPAGGTMPSVPQWSSLLRAPLLPGEGQDGVRSKGFKEARYGRSHNSGREQARVGRPLELRSGGVARVLLEAVRLGDRGLPRPAVRRVRGGENRWQGRGRDRTQAVAGGPDRLDALHRHERCRGPGPEGAGRRWQGHRAALRRR